MPRFDSCQDNDDAINMREDQFADPLDLLIEWEANAGMSVVEALRLTRDGYQADAELEQQRIRKRNGRH